MPCVIGIDIRLSLKTKMELFFFAFFLHFSWPYEQSYDHVYMYLSGQVMNMRDKKLVTKMRIEGYQSHEHCYHCIHIVCIYEQ